ncbi:bacteriocin [Clostridia bacterium]|nr:bacteriocin [Clostridia bacterium]
MQTTKRIKHKLFAALMLVICAVLFKGMTVYAADDVPEISTETLSVDEVWLTGDTLRIAVTDKNNAKSQTLELNLKDYAKSGDEYVSIRATDKSGNKSNTVQFKNPYYTGQEEIVPVEFETDASGTGTSESAIPDGAKPFTPGGTGSVTDNATDGDGKEFFTVSTPDGNVFYLIVDRQRTSENVYLLNAVSENDLASLAKPGDGKTGSAMPEVTTEKQTQAPVTETAVESVNPPASENSGNMSTVIFAVIAIIVAGGAGYYIKVIRPKKNAADDDDNRDDDTDENIEVKYNSGTTDADSEDEAE